MEIITNKIKHNLNINKYIKEEKTCFLDIETTGLDRNKRMIYLIGVLYYDLPSKVWLLKQYFTNSMDKESKLLKVFIKDLSSYEKIITYNGDSFDIPFINHRLKLYNINNFISKDKSFDVYRIIRENRHYLNLKNLKLKTIEESLGFYREDQYSGFDCIKFYYDYLNTNDLKLKENILKHNYDDLVHMLDIMEILDAIDNKKSIYINLKNKKKKLTIKSLEFSQDTLEIYLDTNVPFQRNIKYFSNNYSISSKDLRKLHISIDIKLGYISKNEICTYIDISNYSNIINDLPIEYDIPSNFLVLMVEKEYYVENIKKLINSIFNELLLEKIIY